MSGGLTGCTVHRNNYFLSRRGRKLLTNMEDTESSRLQENRDNLYQGHLIFFVSLEGSVCHTLNTAPYPLFAQEAQIESFNTLSYCEAGGICLDLSITVHLVSL